MTVAREILYLSPPAKVNMADSWFEIASIDHFWIQRRFDVFRRLAGDLILDAKDPAEIGCGHGLFQRQIEDAYGRALTGFDLNELALRQNLSRLSKIYCYDVYQMDPSLQGRFDLLFLFDVLEHISDQDRFLGALKHHLATSGKLVVNVPAGQWAYSNYDRAAGHVRRYLISSLRDVARRNDLEVTDWTYWGFPLLPTLVARKIWLLGSHSENKIITAGFDMRGNSINRLLKVLSKCETIPQKLIGTSLMAVLQTRRESE
jgi:SAM-dependent methyltransferase